VVRHKRKYTEAMYTYHFCTNAYKRLTIEEPPPVNQDTRSLIIKTMQPGCGASKAIMTYHHRSLKTQKRDKQAYCIPKLHKDPIVDRPIISGINDISEVIIKIAEHYTTPIIHHTPTPTRLRDSQALIDNKNDLGALPPNAKLFTADAKAMYTSIKYDINTNAI
jgi:hypothetical protein